MNLKIATLSLALISGFGLGGCATVSDPGGVTAPNIAAIIQQVQSACTQACKFVPTAATIAAIVTAGNPGVVSAAAIAEAICAAIAPVKAAGPMARRKFGGRMVSGAVVNGWLVSSRMRGSSAVPRVNGVPIQGYYID